MRKFYICGTVSTDLYIGYESAEFFTSIKALKKKKSCWEECGILEVSINLEKGDYVVEPMSRAEIVKRHYSRKNK